MTTPLKLSMFRQFTAIKICDREQGFVLATISAEPAALFDAFKAGLAAMEGASLYDQDKEVYLVGTVAELSEERPVGVWQEF